MRKNIAWIALCVICFSLVACDNKIDEHEGFTELVSIKADLVTIVSDKVEAYRNNPSMGALNPNHDFSYPEDFPDVSTLPKINSDEDFVIRQAEDPTSMFGIYGAVAIGESHELQFTVAEFINSDETSSWGIPSVHFSKVGDADFDSWVLEE